jgi:hypothetical protein
MRTFPTDHLNRRRTGMTLVLTGGGRGAAPSWDAPGAPSNLFSSFVRTGVGRYVATLAEKARDVRIAGATYENSDYDTTPNRKRILIVDKPVAGDQSTIVFQVEEGAGDRTTDEFTDPLASAAAGLKAATATVASIVTLTAADLLTAGKNELLARPRNITFTTAGGTAADAPANAVIVGTDINGDALTETVTLAQTATIAEGVKAFRTITTITYPAADGAGATVAIGYGNKFGLRRKAKTRAGAVNRGTEIAAGSVVTNGTLVVAETSPPNGTYTPNTVPNGSNDYSIEYESVAAADLETTESFHLELAIFRGVEL